MDNRPVIDREMLVPILIGVFSLLGIMVALLFGRSLSAPAQVVMTPSATPFQYQFLGTEPVVGTLPTDSENLPSTFEEDPIGTSPVLTSPVGTAAIGTQVTGAPGVFAPTDGTQGLLIPTRLVGGLTPLILQPIGITSTPGTPVQSANTSTPTSVSGPPMNAGATYDDVDSHFLYSGSWEPTTIAGRTLRVSATPGSTIRFRFIGREMRLFYEGGATLGEMSIMVDNQPATLDQSSGTEWVSSLFPNGTHTVLITHIGGGAVNIDYVIIPEVSNTATPSPTPTQNQ